MLSPFQCRKAILGFYRFDQTGDGIVQAQDFDTLAEKMAGTLGLPTDSPQYAALLAGTRRVWENFFKPVDSDGDDCVTLQEHLASVDAFLQREHAEQESQATNSAIFDALDADDDGRVDLAEFSAFVTAMAGTDAEARAAFGILDGDGSGVLSSAEVTKAWFDYYNSNDRSAPGSHFFGRL